MCLKDKKVNKRHKPEKAENNNKHGAKFIHKRVKKKVPNRNENKVIK